MNILCVDNDKNILRFFRDTIEFLLPDDRVELASSAAEALHLLNESSFDLVITDLVMPDISGLDLLQIIKNTGSDTEVIIMTGHASMESALAALREGARDYLEKPVNMSLLLEKVENIREFRRIASDAEEGDLAEEAAVTEAEESIMNMEKKIAAMKTSIIKLIENVRAGTESVTTERERENFIGRLRSFLPMEQGETP